LTPDFGKLSISPESSDGFASVGTILPKEEATLLPGGLFAFCDVLPMGDLGVVRRVFVGEVMVRKLFKKLNV
jgi:hypothetical protein